jgi:hypothetical protein
MDHPRGGADKGLDGHRPDSTPIANGIIKTGDACDVLVYDPTKPEAFAAQAEGYDGLIVRIMPGVLDRTASPGAQAALDALMNQLLAKGKLVWPDPLVRERIGAKESLYAIRGLSCGLADTAVYRTREEFDTGLKTTVAFQPRVIKQNHGAAGHGIWAVWLQSKPCCSNLGDNVLQDHDMLKLMEMSDEHVEYRTVAEFVEFCTNGRNDKSGEWRSATAGGYLAEHGVVVDQRLLPRICEGEVHLVMVGDKLQQIVHKRPTAHQGLSTARRNVTLTFFQPGCSEYAELERRFMLDDLPKLLETLDVQQGHRLPLFWTVDLIPKHGCSVSACALGACEFVAGEFNCSSVSILEFQDAIANGQAICDIADEDYRRGAALADTMGRFAHAKLVEHARAHYQNALSGAPEIGLKVPKAA